jgi:hypothetical protein
MHVLLRQSVCWATRFASPVLTKQYFDNNGTNVENRTRIAMLTRSTWIPLSMKIIVRRITRGMFLSLIYYLVLDLTSPSLGTITSSETKRIASPLGSCRFLLAYLLETPNRRTRAPPSTAYLIHANSPRTSQHPPPRPSPLHHQAPRADDQDDNLAIKTTTTT